MSLQPHLRELTVEACTTNPQIIAAYEHVKKACEANAMKGARSWALNLRTFSLSDAQLRALKARLTQEGLQLVEHSGGDQRNPYPAWTELKW